MAELRALVSVWGMQNPKSSLDKTSTELVPVNPAGPKLTEQSTKNGQHSQNWEGTSKKPGPALHGTGLGSVAPCQIKMSSLPVHSNWLWKQISYSHVALQ